MQNLLEQLNPEQRLAAETTEGPLLILAGAGTGKTQVITRRIAWLIATRRAHPSEILALTFTDKAAAEMKHRVVAAARDHGESDVERAEAVTLSTFHSFCNTLLQELDPDLKIMFITGFAAVALNPDNQAPKDAKILSKPFHLRDLVDEVERMLAA